MAAALACRKRSASPFLDEVVPAPPHLAKRGRFSPCPAVAAQQPPLTFDPLDALRSSGFHGAVPGKIEACFAASTAEACRSRVASAAARCDGGGMEECAAVLVEQMAAAADMADARSRASWILKLIVEGAVGTRAAAPVETRAAALREENAVLKAKTEELERDNGVLKRGVAAQQRRQEELERDNGVLKRGVAVLHGRLEEAERAAGELRKKATELAAANYALGVQARGGVDSCRFQVFRGPDVF